MCRHNGHHARIHEITMPALQLPSKAELVMTEKYCLVCSEHLSFSEPRFSRISNVDPVVALAGRDKSTDERGFLDVELSLEEALWLARVLKRHSIQALPMPIRYRQVGVALDAARSAAQKYIDDIRLDRRGTDFSDVEAMTLPWGLSKVAYGFISKSENMRIEGKSPAGITVCVDRVSGEVLNPRKLLNIELMQMLAE